MSSRMEYKEFDNATLKGIKDAKRHQQALYKRYDKVESVGGVTWAQG